MLRLKESTSKAGYLRLAMDGNAAAESAAAASGDEAVASAGHESEDSEAVPAQPAANSFLLAPPSSSGDPRGESAFELSRHLSKSPLARVLSEAAEDKSPRPKMEFKPTPRRAPRNGKGGGGGPAESDGSRAGNAACEQHSFLTDVTDVRQMEQGLLQLLHDFHSGKLQAFGKDCTFEKMEHVREQQERLARLHFELNAQQEHCGPESEEGRQLAKDNLTKLIENLQHLSQSIEQLQSHTQGVQTDV
ncbi:coiled-coil domain-containing protein 28B isoform X2 [Dermacentor albipictus]|uniref:coiled-coil domain-containing protein 28B isoform X2 n=1 Tax=Dermacentor albipictus TaxID=60249 RepID=UPI0038FC3D76